MTTTVIATREQLEYSGVYVAFMGMVVVLIVAMALLVVLEQLQRGDDPPGAAEAEGPAPAFTCPDCGTRSWNPNDGEHGYCGRCKAFTGRPAGLDIPTTPIPQARPA